MQTKTLIEASAEVLTITRLKAGDVYKRIAPPTYSGDPALKLGVVTSVMNNGEDSAFTSLELTPTYAGITAETKVFTAGMDLVIFPATPDEIQVHCTDAQRGADKAVQEAAEKLNSARATQALVSQTIARVLRGELTAPASGDHVPALPADLDEDTSKVELLTGGADTDNAQEI